MGFYADAEPTSESSKPLNERHPLWSKVPSDGDYVEEQQVSITAWVQLNTSGQVTVYNPAAEMGQGSMTALAVLIAEEMDADWSKVVIEQSPVEPDVYGRSWGRSRNAGGTMITVGSHTVSGYYNILRHAGAQARYVLLDNVSKYWKVPINELVTAPGVVIHKPTDRKISYGEIAEFAKAPGEVPEIPEAQMKSPDQFRLIGTYIPRHDIPEKVDGSALFAMDVQLPDMVYGVVSRSPVHGSKPNLTNESAIKDLPGVIDIITLDHGIGVIAGSLEHALEAKKSLEIEWSKGATAEHHSSNLAYGDYEKIADDNSFKGSEIKNNGDVEAALNNAAKTYSFDYTNDYVYHAQMEPLNAVVNLSEDGSSAEVWAGTQAPGRARAAAAKTLGIDISKVKFNCCYLGGGFGRRSMSDYIEEAALLAKAIRKPLKLIWTREDDIQYGTFRPMSLQRMQAGVDEDGNVIAWRHNIIGPGGRLLASGADTNFYSFPNQQIEVREVDHGIRTKHWRAVGHGPNKFAIEAFIDEIAKDQNIDGVVFREKLMANYPRAQRVLQTVVEMSNWSQKPAKGRAKGIAFAERSGSLAAGVCEISLDESSNKISVHRIWSALDAGVVVQPDNAVAQMEGAIIFGISSVLNESISFKNGVVEQSNFHDYPLLRMAEAPESIDVKIIDSQEPPSGIGEAGLPWVGGAIANAFYALTKKRLRHMPFSPAQVQQVLTS
jgi:isoquinoline 1-oxidoreductase beta subunit